MNGRGSPDRSKAEPIRCVFPVWGFPKPKFGESPVRILIFYRNLMQFWDRREPPGISQNGFERFDWSRIKKLNLIGQLFVKGIVGFTVLGNPRTGNSIRVGLA